MLLHYCLQPAELAVITTAPVEFPMHMTNASLTVPPPATVRQKAPAPKQRPAAAPAAASGELFPCRICGKSVTLLFEYTIDFIKTIVPPVLWRCWLGGRKGIRPVKNWVVGCGMVICLDRGALLHMAQLMPLPLTVCWFSKIQTGFTFLVPVHPGSPGQRSVKRACVCEPY